MIMNVTKSVIKVHNINMNIMENVLIIVQMDFYLIKLIINVLKTFLKI